MRFQPTPLEGAHLIELEPKEDERGFFGRLFCADKLAEQGLCSNFVQANHSYSKEKGTLRGLHYQLSPNDEVKIVRCIRGSFYDLILDLRPESPSFGQSFGAVLNEKNHKMMYVPKGFAHGFLTLEPNSEVLYFVSQFYAPEKERGVRWDDPKFQIAWPEKPIVISDRDRTHPDFSASYHLGI